MISRINAILLTLFGIFLGGSLVFLSPALKNSSLDLEFWAYIAGTMIAIFALGITIWQVRTTIQHNELTNEPHLQLHNHILSKDLAIEIFITNDGLGPAVIKSSKFYFQGKEIPYEGTRRTYLLVQAMFDGQDFSPSYSHLDDGSMIPAGGRQIIFKVDFKGYIKDEVAFIERWTRISNKVQIIVEYASIYGDKKILDDRIQD